MGQKGDKPTDGRWKSNRSKSVASDGTKARQRKDAEDRAFKYREWHRSIGPTFYVSDVDHIEYSFVGDKVVPIAVMELTRVDCAGPVSDLYLKSIEDRFSVRDAQGKFITTIASMLKVKAWIVLFSNDLSMFWVYNLTDGKGWWKNLTPERYVDFLVWLRGGGAKC